MTEPDLPYIKPVPEIPPETDEALSPTSDVKNPLHNHEPIEKMETGALDCPICGRSFKTKVDLDLHIIMEHKQTKKA
jgi:hypothetical protein